MKILLVSDYGWPAGGIEQFVYEFVACSPPDIDCQVLTWNMEVHLPPHFDGVVAPVCGDVRVAWSAMRAADLVLVVTSFNVRMLSRLVLDFVVSTEDAVVTVVQTSQHSDPDSTAVPTQDAWLRDLVTRSAAVVAVSDDVDVALRQLCRYRDHVRPTVIENAARLSPSANGVERGRRHVTFIGRPHQQKGYPLYERLASDLSGMGIEFHANTVSVPPEASHPGIEYSWLLGDAELVDLFDHTDLLIAPYMRADGWPLALLEAINCGVPVLGFDSPGVGSLLRRHGQQVVEPTYEALRDATVAWVTGRSAIVPPIPGQVPTWDQQISRYIDLLRSVESCL
jgi:glycosyltransferase involved in cell wall biosynthesis